MSEKEMNENYVKNQIQGVCQDCIHLDKIVPIIDEMLSDAMVEGLEQSRFDKTMLELENQELKEKVKKLSQWDKNKDTRNSRQRVANKELLRQNKKYKEMFKKLKKFLKEDVEKEKKYLYEKSDKFFEGKDFGDKGYGCAIQSVQAIQDYLLDVLKEVE